ncbi:MAG: helix-turn-helix domain-containing protein [Pseudomonadota bacterium]
MSKVLQFRAPAPSGWSKDRWVWLRLVRGDSDLSPMARLVACALGFGFSNSETGECRPGYQTLADDCATSIRTIERCMLELQTAGWITRLGGESQKKAASIILRLPERPPELAGDKAERPPVLAGERPPVLAATPASSGGPPTPPNKEQPNMNQRPGLLRAASQIVVKGGQMPAVLTTRIDAGSAQAALWDCWLSANGFPSLDLIGLRIDQGSFEMPVTVPGRSDDAKSVAFRIAGRWAEWLKERA